MPNPSAETASKKGINRPFALFGFLITGCFFVAGQLSLIMQIIAVCLLIALGVITFLFRKKMPHRRLFAYFFIGALCIGYFIGYTAIRYQPSQSYAGKEVSLSATLLDMKHVNEGSYQYTVRAKRINGKRVIPFSILLTQDQPLSMTYSDTIEVQSLYLKSTSDHSDYLGLDDYSRSSGVYLSGSLPYDAKVTIDKATIRSPFSYCKQFRDLAMNAIDTHVQAPYCYLLDGMIFGVKSNIPFDTIKNFQRCGIAHLLAISGLHITMVSSLLFFLLALLRIPRKVTPYIGMTLLFGYAAMAGFTPSVLRACIMMGVGLYAPLLMREKDSLNTLGLAACVLLLPFPYFAVNVSFLLSFSASLGLLALHPVLLSRWEERRPSHNRQVRAAKENISLSLSATLVTFPICLLYFSQFSLIAIIVNPIAVPISSLTLTFGLLTAFIGCFIPPLGSFFGFIAGGFSYFLNQIAALFARIPFASIYIPQQYISIFLLSGFCIFGLCLFAKHRFEMFQTALLSFLCLCLIACLSYQLINTNVVRVAILGNKSGYSVITACGDHATVIGCGGGSYSGKSTYQYLMSMGVKQIDLLILPSFTKEYARGAPFLIDEMPVGCILAPESGIMYSQTHTSADQKNIPIYPLRDQEFTLPNASCKLSLCEENPVVLMTYKNNRIAYAISSKFFQNISDTADPQAYITEQINDSLRQKENDVTVLLQKEGPSSSGILLADPQSDYTLSLGKKGILYA